MKKLCVVFGVLLSVGASACLAAPEEAIEVPWKQVCQAAGGRALLLTTTIGERVEGLCISVSVDEISVRAQDRQVVKIARSALTRIQVHRSRQGKQLRALHRGLHRELRTGLSAMFSPMAPVGLVMVPGTLAWGAVAAPFCLLADIGDDIAGLREIRPF